MRQTERTETDEARAAAAALLALTPWQVHQRLQQFFEPFQGGAAYGTGRVEADGGRRSLLVGLAFRSKNRPTVDEAVAELNTAHRRAVALAAASAGVTAGALLAGWLRSELLRDSTYRTARLSPELAETLAVLLCDLLHVSPVERLRWSDGGPAWPFWNWRDVDADQVAEVVAAAVRLEQEPSTV